MYLLNSISADWLSVPLFLFVHLLLLALLTQLLCLLPITNPIKNLERAHKGPLKDP